ncbi:hypothetical protein Ahia01_000652400, partial [Argonauta hians]
MLCVLRQFFSSRSSTPNRGYHSNVSSQASPSLSPCENISMYQRNAPNPPMPQTNMVFNNSSNGIPFRTPTTPEIGSNYFPQMPGRISIRTP